VIEPRWLSKNGLLILHEDSIREHGGSRGMRDEGLLESALARSRNILLYSASVSLAQLAAA
jgi:death-on-curing protein